MDDELTSRVNDLARRVKELEEVQGHHRAQISQHQSALKTVAQIMEVDRGVDTPV